MRPPRLIIPLLAALMVIACSNDPYPRSISDRKVLYSAFRDAPRTLDPVQAYTTNATAINGNIYESLLEYHYLERPYQLIPSLATAVPKARPLEDGRVTYEFELRPDLLFQDDVCFLIDGHEQLTRQVIAADVAFELMRIADPKNSSPVIAPLSNIEGFQEFHERLKTLDESEPDFSDLSARERYEAAGPIQGIEIIDDLRLRITLSQAYPQILYWFAMPFTAPVAWESVEYYDGNDGRPKLADHPVGTGPYLMVHYEKQSRIVLEKNPNWYGTRHPEWHAPGATYPSNGEPSDHLAGHLDSAYVGKALPFIDRIEFRREKESIPRFSKFLQGYYDLSGIIKESFDQVIQEDDLSPEMKAMGMRLEKTVEPSVFYIGFNMEDTVVGSSGGERSRKLRQAMSLVFDAEEYIDLFFNGRGVPAHSLIPPGIFGYDPHYVNPYRQLDPARARRLLTEAGYDNGIDPSTGKPLRLTFDSYDTSARGQLRDTFLIKQWRSIGLDVQIDATNYNQFQEKIRKGAYQIFSWGWIADYPDPENFLFLLWSQMRRSLNQGPNTANFNNERYDELFLALKARPNDPERLRLIREAISVVEYERPWIETFYREDYTLYQSWLSNVKPMGLSAPTVKYQDIDAPKRTRLREEWNEPVIWPLLTLVLVAVLIVLPGIRTFFRERQ